MPQVLERLAAYQDLAPLHQPNNLAPIRLAMEIDPELPQVACFDTAFHRGHPVHADCYALPRKFYDEGVRRYGFHGLSYEYVRSGCARWRPKSREGPRHHRASRAAALRCARLKRRPQHREHDGLYRARRTW